MPPSSRPKRLSKRKKNHSQESVFHLSHVSLFLIAIFAFCVVAAGLLAAIFEMGSRTSIDARVSVEKKVLHVDTMQEGAKDSLFVPDKEEKSPESDEQKIVLNEDVVEDEVSWPGYTNAYFGFSLQYPSSYTLCLNNECTQAQEKEIKFLQLWKESQTVTIGRKLIELVPLKSWTGTSPATHGPAMFALNKQDIVGEASAVNGSVQSGKFLGYDAYQFEISGYLNEPQLQRVVTGKHRVVYFAKDARIYRLMYPVDDRIADKIVETLELWNIPLL